MSGYRQAQEANFIRLGNSLFSNIHFGLIVLGRRIAEPVATKRHYLSGWFFLVRFAGILVVTGAKFHNQSISCTPGYSKKFAYGLE